MSHSHEESSPPESPSRRAPWITWSLFMLAWTAALLSTVVVDAGEAVLPKGFTFSLGKVLHVLSYAFLTFLTSRLPITLGKRYLVLLLVSLHGMATEYVQQFVGRYSSLRDVGLDHLGIVLGFIFTWKRWRPAKKDPVEKSESSDY